MVIKMRNMTEEEFNLQIKKLQLKKEQVEFKNKIKTEKNKIKKLSKRSKMQTSNKVLIATISAIILFTIACLFIQYKTAVEVSSTLITLWFSFWTVEIVSLAGIKVSKIIKDYKSPKDQKEIEHIEETNDSEIVG